MFDWRTVLRRTLLAVIAIAAIPVAVAVLRESPVLAVPPASGEWTFDEGSGSVAADSSGSGLDGTIIGATHTTGVSGSALTFDQTTDRVVIPNDPSLDPGTGDFSLSIWFNSTHLPPDSTFPELAVKKTLGGAESGWELFVWQSTPNQTLLIWKVWENGTWWSVSAPVSQDGVWHHAAAIVDGSTLRLYVDGAEVANGSHGASTISSPVDLGIGGTATQDDWAAFVGDLDEIRVWGTALTAADVASLALIDLTVNSTGDAPDANPGDGRCNTGTGVVVECTLRAAIEESNATTALDSISFDIPTTDPGHTNGVWTITPATRLPTTLRNGLVIDGYTQPGSAPGTQPWPEPIDATIAIEIDGSATTGSGLRIDGDDSAVRGLSIHSFSGGQALEVWADRVQIHGNVLGAPPDGETTSALSQGALSLIGSDAEIGGRPAASRNILVGSGQADVVINGEANLVAGNSIGTNRSGTASLGSSVSGVVVQSGTGNLIGVANAGNHIAGQSASGIWIYAPATAPTIHANRIGTTLDGTSTITTEDGILAIATDAVVGGSATGEGNLISGLRGTAIEIAGERTLVRGNTIGTDLTGAVALPNTVGVSSTGHRSQIGGLASGDANIIAHSIEDNVRITAFNTLIAGNSIYGAGDLGIDLRDDGVTQNDPNDADTGPNALQNFPELTSVTHAAGELEISFEINDGPGALYIEFFANPSGINGAGHGEGEVLVGTTSITHPGGLNSYITRIAGSAGDAISATVSIIGTASHTSEFSPTVVATDPDTLIVNTTVDTGDNGVGDGSCTDGSINTAGQERCSLRAAIEEANASPNITTIAFDIPATEPGHDNGIWRIEPASQLPDVTTSLTIDAYTQPGASAGTRPWPEPLDATIIVELDGTTNAISEGLQLRGADTVVRGLSVHGFSVFGIETTAPRTLIEGNFVGVRADGVTPSSNGINLYIESAESVVGGTQPSQRNLISAAATVDIHLESGDATEILGNLIGSDRTGTTRLSSNPGSNIQLIAGDDVRIGSAGSGNLIVGTTGNAILTSGSPQRTVIHGNRIGTTLDGEGRLTTAGGIWLNSPNPVVGGAGSGDGNLVASTGIGIRLDQNATGADIKGNTIGESLSGAIALPVTTGIWVDGNGSNVIGGTGAGDGNTIANATANNVTIVSGNTMILGNQINGAAGLGIDLADDGVTPNDPSDADGGPNRLQNFPEIVSLVSDGATVTATVRIDDFPGEPLRIEFFRNSVVNPSGHGEGEEFIAGFDVTQTINGAELHTMSFAAAPGDLISATSTATTLNHTSEFSKTEIVTGASDTIVVNTTGDLDDLAPGDGVCWDGTSNAAGAPSCSFRAAISESNAFPSIDTIAFDIPVGDSGHNAGVWTISPGSALPAVTTAVTIDGYTQAGSAPGTLPWPQPLDAALSVEVDGSAMTGNGLELAASNAVLRGLAIHGFSGTGALITGSDAQVAGAFVGVRPDGTTAPGNGLNIDVRGANSIIGGTLAEQRNLIGGSSGTEIAIRASAVEVLGNLIGSDRSGATAITTTGIGIHAETGTDLRLGRVDHGNQIVGATTGILLENNWSTNARMHDNLIGTDLLGTTPLPNVVGVLNTAHGSQLGGLNPGEGNVIAHSIEDNVRVNGFNIAILGNSIFGAGDLGIDIANDGISTNDPGDTDGGPNQTANFPVITSLQLIGGSVTATFTLDEVPGTRQIEFFRNPSGASASGHGEGEQLASSTLITHPGGEQTYTVTFAGQIGDEISATSTAMNVTEPRTSEFSATATVVGVGDPIVNTTTDLPDTNPGDGICWDGQTNTAGDPRCSLRAAIAEANANANVGLIEFDIPTTEPGANASGWFEIILGTALPDITSGVTIDGTSQPGWIDRPLVVVDGGDGNFDGLRVAADDVSIRGIAINNLQNLGIDAISGANFTLEHSWIGIRADGNGGSSIDAGGLRIGPAATAARIGSPNAGNVIGYNRLAGIVVEGPNTIVSSNLVGLGPDGVADLGNFGDGIVVEVTGINTRIENNTIADNRGAGVVVQSFNVQILENAIYDNVGLGIDLADDGVTLNDPGDPDTGPNGLQNYPVILGAERIGGSMVITVEIDDDQGDKRLDFFGNDIADPSGHGEGQTFLGSQIVTHPGGGPFVVEVSIPATGPTLLSATSTGLSTSEFSPVFAGPDLATVNTTADVDDLVPGDGACDTGQITTAGQPACSLRAALTEAAATSNIERIEFAIPTTEPNTAGGLPTIEIGAPLPVVRQGLSIDGTTQPGWIDTPLITVDSSTAVGSTFVFGADSSMRAIAVGGTQGVAMELAGDAVAIDGVWIGIAADGTDLAVSGHGIHTTGSVGSTITSSRIENLQGSAGLLVEGTSTIQFGGVDTGNTISRSGDGVVVRGADARVEIIESVIWQVDGLGIDLGDDGPTPNDPGDADVGANDLLNAPQLTNAVLSGSAIVVDVTLDVPIGSYRVEYFANASGSPGTTAGEGETLIASTNISITAAAPYTFRQFVSANAGTRITATLTDLGVPGVTSEFSNEATAMGLSESFVLDLSARHSDLRVAGGLDVSAASPSPIGVAQRFDGIDDALEVPSLPHAGDQLSVTVGFIPDTVADMDVIARRSSGSDDWSIAISGGRVVATLLVNGTTHTLDGGSVSPAQLTVASLVWDGSTVSLVVDGTIIDTAPAAGTIGNTTPSPVRIGGSPARPFDGLIDLVLVDDVANVTATLITHLNLAAPDLASGDVQTRAGVEWSVDATRARSGSGALRAPTVDAPTPPAWAVAVDLDTVGVVSTSWWWISDSTVVDVASGTRTGTLPTDQIEFAVAGAGSTLRSRYDTGVWSGGPSAPVASGRWVEIEVWTDQTGQSRTFVDGVEVVTWTTPSVAPPTGSVGLRAAGVPSGESVFVDDVEVRKYVTPEPTASLGPLERR